MFSAATDSQTFLRRISPLPFTINAVIGNVDRPRGFFTPEQLVTEIGGKKFLITHGDLFGVKHGLEKLRHHGEILDVDVILFGHTHEQYADTQSVPDADKSRYSKIRSILRD